MIEIAGGCTRTRTLDPLIKSQLQRQENCHSFQLFGGLLTIKTRGLPQAVGTNICACKRAIRASTSPSCHSTGAISL